MFRCKSERENLKEKSESHSSVSDFLRLYTTICGILQARILEWVAFPFSRGSCRLIIYWLSHEGSPRILEWVAYPFSSGSSRPKNQTGSPALQADSLPTEPSGKPLEIERLVNYRNLLLVFGGQRTGGEAQEMKTAHEVQKSHPPTCKTRQVTVLPGKHTPLCFKSCFV